jgi:hypothetical protein
VEHGSTLCFLYGYKFYSHGAKNYTIIFAGVSRPRPTVRRLVAAAGRSDVRRPLADGWQPKLAQARILWYTRGSVHLLGYKL